MSNGHCAAGVWEPARRVEANPGLADDAGPELDARQVTFAYSTQAHDEPDFSCLAACLVRMGDH